MDGYLGQMPTGGRLGGKGNLPFETLLACSELFSRHLSAKLQHNAITLLPALLHADWTRARLWSGLRPATPDKTPILGPDARFPGLWWATGHFRSGVLLAPVSATLMADAMLEGKALNERLSVTRFV